MYSGTQWALIAQKLERSAPRTDAVQFQPPEVRHSHRDARVPSQEHRTPDAVRNRWHHLQQSLNLSHVGQHGVNSVSSHLWL